MPLFPRGLQVWLSKGTGEKALINAGEVFIDCKKDLRMLEPPRGKNQQARMRSPLLTPKRTVFFFFLEGELEFLQMIKKGRKETDKYDLVFTTSPACPHLLFQLILTTNLN